MLVLSSWWWKDGAEPVGVKRPAFTPPATDDWLARGGVETADGDSGGRVSKGFARSWPFGPARGVRSAGVEGQNLSMVAQQRESDAGR